MKRKRLPGNNPIARAERGEFVSVVIATGDHASSAEAALESILAQSHTNIEVVIVDDASTDGTLAVLERIARSDHRVRVFPSLNRRGEGWALNLGLTLSSARLVAFSDPRTAVSPSWLSAHIAALTATPDSVASTNGHSPRAASASEDAVDLDRGLLVNKAAATGRIGYFRKDSPEPLADYRHRLERSVESTGIGPADRRSDVLSDPRDGNGNRRRSTDATSRISPIPLHPRRERVTASIASMPSRVNGLERVVAAVLPQVDRILVYLNGYPSVPTFLADPRIAVTTSAAHGDRRDNGKFYHRIADGYHFPIDDDLVYPDDYVDRTVARLEQYDHRAIVGYHGIRLAPEPERYFSPRRGTFLFSSGLSTDRVVHVLGTGTMAYHTSLLTISSADFASTGMADLWVASIARRVGVPMIVLARPECYLEPIPEIDQTSSLYNECKANDSTQTMFLRKHAPWPLAPLPDIGDLDRFAHTA